MAGFTDLTDDQLMVYAGMLEQKGRGIRLEINRKRDRVQEIRGSYLSTEQQDAMEAMILPAFDVSILTKANTEITADTVIAATTVEEN